MTERRWIIPEPRNRLTEKQKVTLFLAQDGRCPECGQRLEIKGHQEIELIDEHVRPLWMGGTNALSNRQLWCKLCARDKTSGEATVRAKVGRTFKKHVGIKKRKGQPMLGSKDSKFKKRMNGEVERRK